MAGSGRRVFTPGEVLTASNVMNYLQDQAVMNFAGTAARGSAIGTAVSEGMVSYLADSNLVQTYDGSSWKSLAYDVQNGIKPIVPTSVTIGTGSGSHDTETGLITFTGATTITVNGVFSNTYKFYKVFYSVDSRSTSSYTNFRFATSGTQTTGSLWYFGGAYWGASGSGFTTFQNASADFGINSVVSGYNNTVSTSELTISLVNKTSPLMAVLSNDGPNGSGGRLYNGRYNDTAGSYDGFKLTYGTGTITGTLKVYGYN